MLKLCQNIDMNNLDIKSIMTVKTHDMHAGGEPLRIIESGFPELIGSNVLAKRQYALSFQDHFRQFLMNEPRGHKDMYGAIITQTSEPNTFDVIFLHNEGYSTMCGHAIIALGRYVVDRGFAIPSEPTTDLLFNCPCGPVKAFVHSSPGDLNGLVQFESVPAFAYKIGQSIKMLNGSSVLVDIAFGGAFYAIISDKALSIDLASTPLSEIIDIGSQITEIVKKKVQIKHPEHEDLCFLYGTIITDGKDQYSDGPSTNICIFADRQVDRSPTGSGVTARIALQYAKGLIGLDKDKEFKSIIGTSFSGRAVRQMVYGNRSRHDSVYQAVIVKVSGMAYHTGDHKFYLEERDPFSTGFQLPR